METSNSCRNLGQCARVVIFLVALCTGCTGQKENEIRVLVAASAHNAVASSIEAFVKSQSLDNRPEVVIVTGSSNGLAQQVQSGAKAHLFISAHQAWTDAIKEHCSSTKPLFSNRLVLAVSDKKATRFSDLANIEFKRIAIAPESVPVGRYARQVIDGLSESERDAIEKKLVFAKDASALVAWLERGVVDAAFLYASDLKHSKKLVTAINLDDSSHEPIVYVIAKLKTSDGESLQQLDELYEWLQAEHSQNIFKAAGFQVGSVSNSNAGQSITVE